MSQLTAVERETLRNMPRPANACLDGVLAVSGPVPGGADRAALVRVILSFTNHKPDPVSVDKAGRRTSGIRSNRPLSA
jgi:hypothetical protein